MTTTPGTLPAKVAAAKPAPQKSENPFEKAMRERKEKEAREADEKRKQREEVAKTRKPVFAQDIVKENSTPTPTKVGTTKPATDMAKPAASKADFKNTLAALLARPKGGTAAPTSYADAIAKRRKAALFDEDDVGEAIGAGPKRKAIQTNWDAFELAAAKPRAKRRTNWVAGTRNLDFLDDLDQEDQDRFELVDRASIKAGYMKMMSKTKIK